MSREDYVIFAVLAAMGTGAAFTALCIYGGLATLGLALYGAGITAYMGIKAVR